MRELELAGHPAIDPKRPPRAGRAPSSRTAFVVSIVVHVLAVYALALQQFADAPAPPRTVADYFVFELPAPRPEPMPAPEPVPEAAPVEPPVEQQAIEPPAPAAEAEPERSAAVAPAAPANEAVPAEDREPAAVDEAPPVPAVESPADEPDAALPQPFVDFSEQSRRAARELITERAAERDYRTFTLDDIAPPRPEPESRPKRSIFDGGGGADFGGRSVGTVGQQRTKFGRKLAELCNALTGGFGVGFMGFGLFSACASPNTGPSGLFPEVRPAYLDLMPECVDTRDTAPALALEAPFPTVKCRLVKRQNVDAEP